MWVKEKDSDREANVHLFRDGKVREYEQYGQYVDPVDNAICCYVPVEEGERLKIGGRFSGTTLSIVHDAVVDGVHRKSSPFVAKAVSYQKSRKLDTSSFLFKTEDGTIDTSIIVTSLKGAKLVRCDIPETIGTIELRLYVTRQLYTDHSLEAIQTYDNVDEDDNDNTVTYQEIPASFCMKFDSAAVPLDMGKRLRELRKMNAKRPDAEPWAIFRFHLRSEESIMAENLNLTWDGKSKKKPEPHILRLEPVPPLVASTKTPKDDGDASSRASSLPPPETHVKSAQNAQSPATPLTRKKQVSKPKLATTPAKTTKVKTEQAVNSPNMIPSAQATEPPTETAPLAVEKSATEGSPPLVTPITAAEDKEARSTSATDLPSGNAVDGISVLQAKGIDNTSQSPFPAKETVEQAPQVPIMVGKAAIPQPAVKPATNSQLQDQPAVPTKRMSETTDSILTDVKRPKTIVTPPVETPPGTPTIISRLSSSSPAPRSKGIEHQVAEQRKKLEAVRQKRLEMAKRQDEIDRKIEPHKKKMAAELEQLNKEMMEEEAAAAEEEKQFMMSTEMLAEYEKGSDET